MSSREAIEEVPQLVSELYRIVDRLEELFEGRPFTIDGHLLGSIGEVLAAYHYGIDLTKPSTAGCDAESAMVGNVEIKTTQRNSIGLRSPPPHLLVFRLDRSGSATEIYNGPGDWIWPDVGKKQKNGQHTISIARLTAIQREVPPHLKLPRLDREQRQDDRLQCCPVCSTSVEPNARYPWYVCRDCERKATSVDGRPLSFQNIGVLGGYAAEYADTGESYDSHECYIEGLRCYADEAKFGGIVVQAWS